MFPVQALARTRQVPFEEIYLAIDIFRLASAQWDAVECRMVNRSLPSDFKSTSGPSISMPASCNPNLNNLLRKHVFELQMVA